MAEAIQADVVRSGERLPAYERLGSKTEAGGGRRATMAGDEQRHVVGRILAVAAVPEFGHAEVARGKAPDPVLRTEFVRARNRLEGALLDVVELSGAARARGK